MEQSPIASRSGLVGIGLSLTDMTFEGNRTIISKSLRPYSIHEEGGFMYKAMVVKTSSGCFAVKNPLADQYLVKVDGNLGFRSLNEGFEQVTFPDSPQVVGQIITTLSESRIVTDHERINWGQLWLLYLEYVKTRKA